MRKRGETGEERKGKGRKKEKRKRECYEIETGE